ncbi:MAG: hypothetical protein R3D02_16035 [Hyphomicrobiales bacterium]
MTDGPAGRETLSKTGLLVMGFLGGLLVAAGLVLWSHYGGTVFFDMLAGSFAGCF